MSSLSTDHRKGLAITAAGGLALSTDIPLIRLADGEAWSVLLVRSGATFVVALAIWLVHGIATGRFRPLLPGRAGIAVAVLYGVSTLAFIAAVYNTRTANLVFILAFNTMFSALLSWIFLKERPKAATLATMVAMIAGVGIIVREGISSGYWVGDLMALAAAFMLASAITVSRGSGRDMGLAAVVATVVPFAIAAFFVGGSGYSIAHPEWTFLNGAVIMPVAFFCLGVGPRYLSGAEVAMFYLLETILAPVWVWFVFEETPSRQPLLGGAIMLAALIAHSLWQLRNARRAARTDLPRRPI